MATCISEQNAGGFFFAQNAQKCVITHKKRVKKGSKLGQNRSVLTPFFGAFLSYLVFGIKA